MKVKILIYSLFCSLFIIGCSEHSQPTITPVQPIATLISPSATPAPTATSIPQNTGGLPNTVEINGSKVTFKERGFSVVLPSEKWQFEPSMYRKESDFEGFVFIRRPGFTDTDGQEFQPSMGILFYTIPEDTDLITFSAILRGNMGAGFPSIDRMFGYEGSEPVLKINGIGYYGMGQRYSTYIIHTTKGGTGIQVSLEIAESLLDQAKPEFYEIMQSLEFIQ